MFGWQVVAVRVREIKEVNGRRKIPFARGGKADRVERVAGPAGLFIAASERWRSKVTAPGSGPGAAIRRELDRAPSNASVVVAFVPTRPIENVPLESLAAWAVIDKPAEDTTIFGSNTRIVIHARAETTGVDAAEDLLARVRKRMTSDDIPAKCREHADAVTKGVTLERSGRVAVLHLELHPAKLIALIACALNG